MASTPSDPQEPEDSWEDVDMDKLRLHDPASVPGAPESVRQQQAQSGSQRPRPLPDSSLDYVDDPQGASATYRASGLSSAGAIAVTTVEHDAPIDPALTAALDNPRERVTVLKFEDQMLRFMRSPGTKQLDFPPLSSYQRLIVHRLAQRFQLDHLSVDTWNMPQEQRSIVLVKTPQSLVPRVLLIDLVSEKRAETSVAPKPGLKLMKRDRGDANGKGGLSRGSDGAGGNGRGGGGGTPEGGRGAASNKSVSEREREYAEARARIFGTKTSSDDSDGEASRRSSGGGGAAAATTTTTTTAAPLTVLAGRAATSAGPVSNSSSSNSPSPGVEQGRRVAKDASPSRWEGERQDGPEPERKPPTVNAREWVDQRKVTWRNREAELSDPDFVRNHGAYRGAATSSSSSSSSNVSGGGPYAYPMAQAPPPPPQMVTTSAPPPPHMAYMVPPPHYMAPAYYAMPPPMDYSRMPPGVMPAPMGYAVYPGMGPPQAGAGYSMRRVSPPPPPPPNTAAQGSSSSSNPDYNQAFPPLG